MTATVNSAEAGIRQIVLEAFPEDRRSTITIRRLARRIEAMAEARDAGDRHDAWRDLMVWVRGGAEASERIRILITLVDASPPVRVVLLESVSRILAETDATGLFSDAGIPAERGFLAEFSERVMEHLLPAPRNHEDLAQLLSRVFPDATTERGLRGIPAELFHRIITALVPSERPDLWAPVGAAFADGFRLLSVRVAGLGLERPLRVRSRPGPVPESPFLRQLHSTSELLAAWSAGTPTDAAAKAWHADARRCRGEIAEIRRRLDEDGVNVDIVYSLEILDRALTRMALMVEVINQPPGYQRSATIHRMLIRLADFAHQDRSIRHLFNWNLSLLYKKIVERSGATGEHYIAYTRKEYRHIWLAAAGGGLLTAGTAAIKVVVHEYGLPPFPEAMLYGLNYAISFLLLGAFGLMLATKQPAMTAATLAQLLREGQEDRVDELVEFTTRISHSQLAAATSNVFVVWVGAWLIDGLWRLVASHPFVEAEEAANIIQTLSPLNSGTVFYAALTGVVLWASSVAGGWFDNWSVYHRLPQAVAEHPLGKWLGWERLRRWSERLRHNAGNWGTSVSLGFMLGLVPALGRFLGLPLDVRHVTLSTGTLALASASLGQRMVERGLLRGLAGIATMFVLNLGVSFFLSLYTAMRAYELDRGELKEFTTRLLRRIKDHPLDFIRGPKTDMAPPVEGAGKE
jgi:site-specific recombinase